MRLHQALKDKIINSQFINGGVSGSSIPNGNLEGAVLDIESDIYEALDLSMKWGELQMEPYEHNRNSSTTEIPKIGRVTMLWGDLDDPPFKESLRLQHEHCKRFGYPLYAILRDTTFWNAVTWTKPAYLLQVVSRELAKDPSIRLDWIFYMDIDSILLNPTIPLHEFLPPADYQPDQKPIQALMSSDDNGLNAGALFLKVDDWTIKLLSATIAFPWFRPYRPIFSGEQGSLTWVVQESGFKERLVMVPQLWFNAYSKQMEEESSKGYMNVHFAGYGTAKGDPMRDWLRKAVNESDVWAVPFNESRLKGELSSFWSGGVRRGYHDTVNPASQGLVSQNFAEG
ncbi:hypothetical protein ABW19_dt0206786 [Dactylella cylindrospora]|nr:hypothetical protein ABW19_dt0206786 [Dactylella cylindrospora]